MDRHPQILFLFSDTGGGHRSAAKAIIEALDDKYGELVSTEMVDFLEDYAPWPFHLLPKIYPSMTRILGLWNLMYRLSDSPRRSRLITTSAWPYVRKATQTLIRQHPSDLIVSLHPLANATFLNALGQGNHRPPFITIVTDLITTHAIWYHCQPPPDLCLVPTEAARQIALKNGLDSQYVRVTGLPVASDFSAPSRKTSLVLKACIGWPEEFPVVLLIGGGDGMGPLERIAQSIAFAQLPATLVIVTGRNQDIKDRLENQKWPIPTFIYGFVHEMAEIMQAADILVTKAGPSTICEALNLGLPMVFYSRVPGQEDGNISYVVSAGAGIWAPQPEDVVAAIRDWIRHPEKHAQAAASCGRLARPNAARQVAEILAQQVGVT
jgi:1,2-diacylglycerol 3-beta-galactosyltransferase